VIGYAQWMSRKAPKDRASRRARDEATERHYRGK
jgi:hypothetical protein